MRVVRIYHAGRDSAHRERDRALVRAGVEVLLVVPARWPGPDQLTDEPFRIVEVPVDRPGDVNRHTLADPTAFSELLQPFGADLLDLHEEPFSAVVRQVLVRRPTLPVVAYAAQNIDKRFPPPFAQWELTALSRLDGIYPCSRQAASVVVGKGFRGSVEVLPLAPPPQIVPGAQQPPADSLRMLLVGRFEPEKGVLDAVRVLHALAPDIDATLDLVGDGPSKHAAQQLAAELGVADRLTVHPWLDAAELARRYADAHVLLAPSRATATWVEQFGRMVVEAQAAGCVVVAYASGALPEVVGDAGVLVPEGDEAGLADAVRALHRDPATWTRLRDAGLDVATTRTWDAVAQGQLALYDAALRGRRIDAPVHAQRGIAVERFGEPARVAGLRRPFALPVLRDRPAIATLLARLVDRLVAHERLDDIRVPRRALRVVYLDHVARMSGGELALLRLIRALPDVEAHVILGEDGPLRESLQAAGAHVEVLAFDDAARNLHRDELGGPKSVLATAGYVRRLARRLRELQPDVVHTNSMKAGYYGATAGRLVGVPVVWHLRDRVAKDYLPPPVVRLTRLLLATLPTLVVSNSIETRRTAGPRVRAGAVVNSPVVHDPYEPVASPRTRGGMAVVGIVGRLAEWKGQDVVVRAFAQLRRRHPALELRIIGSAMFGEDDYERTLHDLVDELGLTDAVTFTGYMPDVEAELNALDVLVHASRTPEPFGQVIVEGMAAGLPVIATDAGGPREIVTDGVDGLLVPPGDVGSLVEALDRLATDAALRARLGEAARLRARSFAPEVIGAQMMRVYRDLTQAREARRRRDRSVTTD